MNTILFIAAGGVLTLIVLAKIPGLEHMVRPVIDLVFTAVKAVGENAVSWGIWLFKILWSCHIEFVRHLILSAEVIDPSTEVRAATEAGG